MNTLSQKARRLALPIVFCGEIFLANCSTLSLTYQYADWLVYWKVDHYFDVNTEQQAFLNNQIGAFKKWHKTEEIPRYISFLTYIKTQWHDGFSQQELDSIFIMYQSLWKSLSLRLAAASTPFLTTLNADQLTSLQQTIRDDNQELLDQRMENGLDPIEQKVEKVSDRLEDWLGSLTLEQKLQIDQHIRNLPDTFQVWFDNRIRRQKFFISLLKQQANEKRLQQEIGQLLSTPEQGASDAYIATMQQQKSGIFSTIMAIDQIISPQQREHATDQIGKILQELKLIAHE